jgi:hypothetical protein
MNFLMNGRLGQILFDLPLFLKLSEKSGSPLAKSVENPAKVIEMIEENYVLRS